MHPMFVQLFIEIDLDDLLRENKQRRARRSRQARLAIAVRPRRP
jgi:RNase P/RNase MRP subunit p30